MASDLSPHLESSALVLKKKKYSFSETKAGHEADTWFRAKEGSHACYRAGRQAESQRRVKLTILENSWILSPGDTPAHSIPLFFLHFYFGH